MAFDEFRLESILSRFVKELARIRTFSAKEQKNQACLEKQCKQVKLFVLLGDLIGEDGGFSNLAFEDALCGIGNSLIDLLDDLFGEPIGETGCPNLVLATALWGASIGLLGFSNVLLMAAKYVKYIVKPQSCFICFM